MEMTSKRVMCCGTFDYLHPGHLSFLKQAAKMGTELHVVIARDENVQRIKGVLPDHDEDLRRTMVSGVEVVDCAILGHPGSDFLRIVGEINPDVIALGYDQRAPEGLAEAMPHCRIVVLEPHFPEKFKSSLYRQGHAE
jgi:FAD synthetase